MREKLELNGGRNNRVRQSDMDYHDEALDPIYGRETPSPRGVQHQNVTPLLSTQDVEYLANHLSQVITQVLSKQEQAPLTRKGNSDFENKVIWYLDNLFNGITEKNERTGRRYYSASKLLPNQANTKENIDTIINEIQSLQQKIESQNTTIEDQTAIIKKQHERIIQYENDVIYKTQKDLIMELIGIADQLRYTLNDYAVEKDFASLYKSIGDLAEWVDGSLQAVGVRKSVSIDDEFDRKRQEIVETQKTELPEKDGKIESILPGYIWAVPMIGSNDVQDGERPKAYEFMIRPEQVARLRYVKSVDEPVQQEQNSVIAKGDENRESIEPIVEDTGNIQDLEVRAGIESANGKKDEKKSSSWKIW